MITKDDIQRLAALVATPNVHHDPILRSRLTAEAALVAGKLNAKEEVAEDALSDLPKELRFVAVCGLITILLIPD